MVGPLLSLLMLLAGERVAPTKFTLVSKQGLQIVLRRRAIDVTTGPIEYAWIEPAHLTDAALRAWYEITTKLRPLPTVIAKSIAAPGLDVEVRVLTLASAVEAIHRTLHDEKVMTKQQASSIRKAAVEAVPVDVRGRVESMLAGLRDLSFGDRVTIMAARLGPLGKEICGPEILDLSTGRLSKPDGRGLWLEKLKVARNGFAHQSRRSPEELRQYALETHVLYETLRWANTAWLLLEIGFTAEEIAQAFARASAFRLFRKRLITIWPRVAASA